MLRFRDEALAAHRVDHVDLVFANAAIAGGGSFINDPREQWERVFAVNWWGVYYTARAFLPLLIASTDGVLVNTSSVNGFWASLGPAWPHTAYSTAKFAVKGFTESLIEDLRTNAPHVRAVLVMPGYIGTNIVGNSMRAFGVTDLDGDREGERRLARWRPDDGGRGGDDHPRRGAVRRLAHPGRRGRAEAGRVRALAPGIHLRP